MLVVVAPRAGTGDRSKLSSGATQLGERLRRGADHLEILEVDKVHVRRRIKHAKRPIRRERLERSPARELDRENQLIDVARSDMTLHRLNARHELALRHAQCRRLVALSLIHISEPTRRTPISYAV